MVGSVKIKGDGYEKHGIRIVCSPRNSIFGWSALSEIEEIIVNKFKKKLS